jgi:O-antigen/teichoic acid export membrane protein
MKYMKILMQLKKNSKMTNMKKSILILFSGNILSQVILFATTPILTRLYTPKDFGVLASYTALISILLAISILSFEKVIPLVSNEKFAINIVSLSTAILSLFTIIVFAMLYYLGEEILNIFNMMDLLDYFWLIPLSLFIAGLYQIFNYYAIRNNSFNDISISKVSQSLSQVITQIVFSLVLGSNTLWLLIGDGIGRSSGVLRLFKVFLNTKKKFIRVFKLKLVFLGFRKFKSFSFKATLSAFLSTFTIQVPIIIIGYVYDPYFAGLYLLSQKVIGLPITLISRSISQVYYSEAIKLLREGPDKLSSFFKKSIIKIFLISLVPFIFVSVIAPTAAEYFLGDEWLESGRYIQLLIPMFIAQISITPLGQTLYVTNSTGLHLIWEIIRLILLSIGISIPIIYNNDIDFMIIGISVSMALSYAAYFVITLLHLNKLKEINRSASLK